MGRSREASQSNHKPKPKTSVWSRRYGDRHRLDRIDQFPPGIAAPEKVRIYARQRHFVLQLWDPDAKKTASIRVNGDLVSAIVKAREIEAKLVNFKASGQGRKKLGHEELLQRYLGDLNGRVNAAELSPATLVRYRGALEHFLAFVQRLEIQQRYPYASLINREFQQAFAGHLQHLHVARNGHPHAQKGPLRSPQFILDTVRAMFAWAADPHRGHLLPDGFCNPFAGCRTSRYPDQVDPFGDPDLTIAMAIEFLSKCDAFQLPLFAFIATCGLRASEPAFVFREHVTDGWIRVNCLPELAYWTKGRRDKRFPLVKSVGSLLSGTARAAGLLFTRRGLAAAEKGAPLWGFSLSDLTHEFQRRCASEKTQTGVGRESIRDDIFKLAGGLTYDLIAAEFQSLARQLAWPAEATLKDFRHLFSTCLENAGMPEYYRRYLMGHSPGRAALTSYTHLNQLREKYCDAVESELRPICEAIETRSAQLKLR